MMTYLLNLFNPKNNLDRTNYHRVDRYCGSHYMLEYLKTNAFNQKQFPDLIDAKKIIPVLKKYVKIQTMELNGDDMTSISQNEHIENQNIEHNENGLLSKSDIIERMTSLIGITNEPKAQKDILQALYVMQGHNKDAPKQDSETIRYYLPQRCESCDFKNNFNI